MSKKKNRSPKPPKAVDREKQKAITVDLLDRASAFMSGVIQFADVKDIGEAEDTFMREAAILFALDKLGETITRIKQNDAGIVKRYLDFPWHTLGMLTYSSVDFDEENDFDDNYYWLIYVYRVRILNIIDLEKGFDVENVVFPPWIENIDYFIYGLENGTVKINPDLLSGGDDDTIVEKNSEEKMNEPLKSKACSDTIAWIDKMLSRDSSVKPDKNIKTLSEWGKSVWTVRKR